MEDPVVEVTQETKSEVSLGLAWSPYVVVALLLVITRLPWLPIRDWLTAPERTVAIESLFGFEGIDWAWRILNNPGIFPFIAVALCFIVARKMKSDGVSQVFKRTGKQIKNAAIALMFGIALVQIMRNTNYSNPYGPLEAMTSEVAKALVDIFGGLYPLISPIIGGFGALVSGSHTVSNIMFMPLQFEAALLIGLPTVMIAMSQSIGASVGNMVAINNIIAITATTNATGKEGKLFISATPPCIIYALLLSAMLFIYLALGTSWVA
jgi:lactate permease